MVDKRLGLPWVYFKRNKSILSSITHKHTYITNSQDKHLSLLTSNSPQPLHPRLMFITHYHAKSSEMIQEKGVVWLFNKRQVTKSPSPKILPGVIIFPSLR